LNNIKVHFSVIDNDDTLAAHAMHYKASILSDDKDYFRYINANYVVYESFFLSKGNLILKEKEWAYYEGRKRALIYPPPETVQKYPPFSQLNSEYFYLKGTPTPLIKLF
jgi:hypothetical protein